MNRKTVVHALENMDACHSGILRARKAMNRHGSPQAAYAKIDFKSMDTLLDYVGTYKMNDAWDILMNDEVKCPTFASVVKEFRRRFPWSVMAARLRSLAR